MLIPVKCFTCGTVLGDKYEYFCQEVRKRKLREGNTEGTMYLTKTNTQKSVEGETLDHIGLKKTCCRTAMLTHVDVV